MTYTVNSDAVVLAINSRLTFGLLSELGTGNNARIFDLGNTE